MELLDGTQLVRPHQILSIGLSFRPRYCKHYVEDCLISKRSNIVKITMLAVKSFIIVAVLACVFFIVGTVITYTYFNPYN